jgi:hypothetical protein
MQTILHREPAGEFRAVVRRRTRRRVIRSGCSTGRAPTTAIEPAPRRDRRFSIVTSVLSLTDATDHHPSCPSSLSPGELAEVPPAPEGLLELVMQVPDPGKPRRKRHALPGMVAVAVPCTKTRPQSIAA